ncbi:hypothetical protein F4810DRAFT_145312 [Camillea tinctor]|nr:hypothetical protein F4810DRAFT_145312 [Camillea tinctor]
MFGNLISPSLLQRIVEKSISFEGSLAGLNTYFKFLLKNDTINTEEAIQLRLHQTPLTEKESCHQEIKRLANKPLPMPQWTPFVVSWITTALRPLRIEELGTAAAIKLSGSSLMEMRQKISVNMYQDVQEHVGSIVTIEQRYAWVAIFGSIGAKPLLFFLHI